jgi:hypothetical protein
MFTQSFFISGQTTSLLLTTAHMHSHAIYDDLINEAQAGRATLLCSQAYRQTWEPFRTKTATMSSISSYHACREVSKLGFARFQLAAPLGVF